MADPYVPPPVGAGHPWWAILLAPELARTIIAWVSAALLVLSIAYGVKTLKSLTELGRYKVLILLFWIAVPPCWFWFEYFGLYRYDSGAHKPDWDSFKYGQDVSSKVWLALVTTLTILYFGKDIRG
jgi:hypothetical protein